MRRALVGLALLVSGLGLAACSTSGQGSELVNPAGASSSSAPSTSAAPSTPVSTPVSTPPSTTPPPVVRSSSHSVPPPLPTLAQATQALHVALPAAGLSVVRVGADYQALAFDQTGHVSFWSYAPRWHQVGSSGYPYDSVTVGAPAVKAQGTVLAGMSNATYILTGLFSGDGTADAIAYTNGSSGWGVIKALPNGNLASSGQGVDFGGIGLESGDYFVNGTLETAECSAHTIVADCGGNNRVLKFWAWRGSDFQLVRRAGLPD